MNRLTEKINLSLLAKPSTKDNLFNDDFRCNKKNF